uniref:Uncharacterized protein LOC104246177 isoform X4 n=1 Tax=Nicotiana sylvestris TaxID=4096 RepID=A0A1U7YE64_NICSY|nr:PREDICTED: uncharacterized protein LOC104246177 isoform X4 [Nicotiana sylvestris]
MLLTLRIISINAINPNKLLQEVQRSLEQFKRWSVSHTDSFGLTFWIFPLLQSAVACFCKRESVQIWATQSQIFVEKALLPID